jgi:hypothetical protein
MTDKTFAGHTHPDKPMLAVHAFPNEPTVTMVFPKEVRLTLPDHSVVRFEAGPQEVPESLIDNWYLKANGVKKYEPVLPPPRAAATPNPSAADEEESDEDEEDTEEVEEEPEQEASPVNALPQGGLADQVRAARPRRRR